MRETRLQELIDARIKLIKLTDELDSTLGRVEIVKPDGSTDVGNVSPDLVGIVSSDRKMAVIQHDLTNMKTQNAEKITNFVNEINAMDLINQTDPIKEKLARNLGLELDELKHIANFPDYVAQTEKFLNADAIRNSRTRRETYKNFVATFQKLNRLWTHHLLQNSDEAAEGFVPSPKQLNNKDVKGWLQAMAQSFDGIACRDIHEVRRTLDSYYPKDGSHTQD